MGSGVLVVVEVGSLLVVVVVVRSHLLVVKARPSAAPFLFPSSLLDNYNGPSEGHGC